MTLVYMCDMTVSAMLSLLAVLLDHTTHYCVCLSLLCVSLATVSVSLYCVCPAVSALSSTASTYTLLHRPIYTPAVNDLSSLLLLPVYCIYLPSTSQAP